MTPRQRRLARAIAALLLIAALAVGYVLFPWPIPAATSFELVAHRGVHQTHPSRDAGVTDDTCTAAIIDPSTHGYIENTIPSMEAAFAAGATAVELDIHRTADDELIVFHDWTLDCRTNGTGVTNEQTVAYLKSLDIGHGYTADGGRTFPLRGTGIGLMKTLPEILAAFPDEAFIIHDKDGDAETSALLARYLQTISSQQRARLTYWGGDGLATIQQGAPEIGPYFFSPNDLRGCLGDYLFRMLLTGALPARCQHQIIGIPYSMLGDIPGWPHLILARAHQAGARVFIIDVDTPEELADIADLPLDGIQTNRIEVIGPLLAEKTGHSP